MAEIEAHGTALNNDNEEDVAVDTNPSEEVDEDIVTKATLAFDDVDSLLREAGFGEYVCATSSKTTGTASTETGKAAVGTKFSDGRSYAPHKKNKRLRLALRSEADQKEHVRLEELVLGSKASGLFDDVSIPARDGDDKFGAAANSEDRQLAVAEFLQPAWNDDEDGADNPMQLTRANKFAKIRRAGETIVSGKDYAQRLRKQFQQQATDGVIPKWASTLTLAKKIQREEADQSADALLNTALNTAGELVRTSTDSKVLPNYAIRLKRCPLLNRSRINKAAVEAVRFHPTSQVALVASWDRHLNIFQVDEEKTDPLLQNFYFAKFPISDAVFCGNQQSNEVLLCSKLKPHLHSIDLIASKISKIPAQLHKTRNQPLADQRGFSSITASHAAGNSMLALTGAKPNTVHIIHTESKEHVVSLQLNGTVHSCVWHAHAPHLLYAVGDEGIIYLWDIRYDARCVGRGFDQGCLKATAIDACGGLLVVGSSSGVVNVYDAVTVERTLSSSTIGTAELVPIKVVQNLTTPITGVQFNEQCETLAIWSRQAPNSMRLLRTADFSTSAAAGTHRSDSMHVFHNFPTQTDPLGHIEHVQFSPSSGYMAVANYQGRVNSYRMLHYNQY